MNRKTTILVAAVLGASVGIAGLSWWMGMRHGMTMTVAPAVTTTASADPAQWTIPQGEEATRRHLRDGLKAGDVDPSTGLRIMNYHDPMVPGRNFDAPGKSPFMDMMLVPRYAQSNAADISSISVSPRMQQNLGVRNRRSRRGHA